MTELAVSSGGPATMEVGVDDALPTRADDAAFAAVIKACDLGDDLGAGGVAAMPIFDDDGVLFGVALVGPA